MKKFLAYTYLGISGLTTVLALSVPHAMHAMSAKGVKYTLKNPLAFNSIQQFLVAILNIVIVIAIPIVVLFIIYSGFKYVTARGNAQATQEATRSLTYAIIGGVLIIGAVAIAQIISNLVGAFQAP